MISLKQLSKSFEQQAVLSNIDLTIAESQFVSIVGPSGCGKSTLLRLVAGLELASEGEVTISGDSPSNSQQPLTSFVFQSANLLPWRSAVENVRLPLELQNLLTADSIKRINSGLEQVGLLLEDHDKFPHMLSGGMQMRVSLARALITTPQVLLLDEPFAALDDILRQQLNEDLLTLWAKQKWTALFVTHNVVEAVFLSQRVLVMSQRPGKIAADITVPFSYPRQHSLRSQADFAKLCGQVTDQLREVAAI